MNFRNAFLLAVSALVALASGAMLAQGVDDQMLLHPPADSWPGYHGDYSGRRHSSLTQITPQNVKNLGLGLGLPDRSDRAHQILAVAGRWHFVLHRSRQYLGGRRPLRPPDLALQRSHHSRESTLGIAASPCTKDIYSLWLPTPTSYRSTPRTGRVRWKMQVADVTKGYWTSMAPLIVGNHVLVGVSGDFDNLSGYIRSIDPETGATQWQWNSTPPAGTPNQTTGGMTWMTGTYDPDLNLVYWGTGKPDSCPERLDAARR